MSDAESPAPRVALADTTNTPTQPPGKGAATKRTRAAAKTARAKIASRASTGSAKSGASRKRPARRSSRRRASADATHPPTAGTEGPSEAGEEAEDEPPVKRSALAPDKGEVYRELGLVLGKELAREDGEETAALRERCAELERAMDAMREARETGPERALQEERKAAARRIHALEEQVAELRKGSAEGALEEARRDGWVDGEGAKALQEQVQEAEAHAAALQRTALALESLSGVTVDAVKQSTWGELEACEAVEAPQSTHAEDAVSEVQLSMRNAEEGREVKFRLYLPEHGETAAYCHVSASEGVELDDMLRGDLDMQRGRMPVLLRALLESLYVEEEEEEAAEDAGEQEEEQSGAESDASAN